MLEVNDLHVSYSSGAILALRGISFTVQKGEIVSLIGSNGAGKSTTLRALSGMLPVSRGSIVLQGTSLVGKPAHDIVRQGLSHCPEGRGIFPSLSVKDNLALGAYSRSDRNRIRQDTARQLERFPILAERIEQLAGTLSGGEQQMLAVARALMARPQILLLDEPSLGLAPQVVQNLFRLIEEINRDGVTILLVEQNANMALRIAHRGYVLETGEIKTSGPAQALAASDEVRRSYLGIE